MWIQTFVVLNSPHTFEIIENLTFLGFLYEVKNLYFGQCELFLGSALKESSLQKRVLYAI